MLGVCCLDMLLFLVAAVRSSCTLSRDPQVPTLKSVKRLTQGLVPGSRSELVLRVPTGGTQERDAWFHAMKQEAMHPLMRAVSRRKFLLRTRSASGRFNMSPRASFRSRCVTWRVCRQLMWCLRCCIDCAVLCVSAGVCVRACRCTVATSEGLVSRRRALPSRRPAGGAT